jgi:hypothetical protein
VQFGCHRGKGDEESLCLSDLLVLGDVRGHAAPEQSRQIQGFCGGFECLAITSEGGSASETTQRLSPDKSDLAPVSCAGISAMPERASGINADELANMLWPRSRTLPESETRGWDESKEQILAKMVPVETIFDGCLCFKSSALI